MFFRKRRQSAGFLFGWILPKSAKPQSSDYYSTFVNLKKPFFKNISLFLGEHFFHTPLCRSRHHFSLDFLTVLP